MDDEHSSLFQAFPAPYIANTERLISSAAGADHRVFCRGGSDSLYGTVIDYFSAGSFAVHEVLWSAGGGDFKWQGMKDKFAALDCGLGPLAGYLSYEAGFAFELEKWQSLRHPESGSAWRFLQLPCWYEANHTTKSARICVMDGADERAVNYLKKVVQQTAGYVSVTSYSSRKHLTLAEVAAFGELSQDDYEEAIQRVLEDIRSGRYYELNLTQRFRTQSRLSPAELFIDLFNGLSPRRGFFCEFQGETIISVSPELYLKKAGERVSTRPIKGSMSGSASAWEMAKLSAEHIMVVDLARNDLGRVSDCGWVAVEELQMPARFGQLTHLESLVSGTTSLRWQDIIHSTFPAASITGMPKVIVVQSIAQYEKSCRGLYTGACGWISTDGDLDFNVAIRTLVATPDGESWQYELGAGGAITADSNPGDEYLECLRKAQPLLSALMTE